jgi:O-antigen/teichoic acid export membrane protein
LGAIVGHVLSYLVAAFFGSMMILKIYRVYQHDSKDELGFIVGLRFMIKYGIPLYGSILLLNLLSQYQPMVLVWFASNAEVGNFSVAALFGALITLLETPISTTLLPVFSRFNPNRDQRDLKGIFRHSSRYILMLMIPSSVFLTVASQDLVGLLFGSQYTLAPLYVAMYSTTFLYTGFKLVLGSFFNGIGRTDISLKAMIIQTIVAIPLTFVLTYLYKVSGLVLSIVISTLLPLIYTSRIAYTKYEMSFDLKCALKVYLAAFLSAIPTLILTQFSSTGHLLGLVLAALSFIAVYLTLIPAIRAINEADLSSLGQIFSRIKFVSQFAKIILSYEAKILSLTH